MHYFQFCNAEVYLSINLLTDRVRWNNHCLKLFSSSNIGLRTWKEAKWEVWLCIYKQWGVEWAIFIRRTISQNLHSLQCTVRFEYSQIRTVWLCNGAVELRVSVICYVPRSSQGFLEFFNCSYAGHLNGQYDGGEEQLIHAACDFDSFRLPHPVLVTPLAGPGRSIVTSRADYMWGSTNIHHFFNIILDRPKSNHVQQRNLTCWEHIAIEC